jgi:thioredoxin-related protein
MKHYFKQMLFALLTFTSNQIVLGQEIAWAKNLTWDKIKQKAKEDGKFIFIDAFATWCLPCKKMDKDVYVDPRVVDLLNKNFISLRVQMDSTQADDSSTKSWYPMVKYFSDFGIDGYPSFLFFNPDAKLAYKDIGYHDAENFVSLLKEALTDPKLLYQRNLEKFRKGQLDFKNMPSLAIETMKLKDVATASEIAKTYKTKYLDKIDEANAFTKENLMLLAYFNELIQSKDRYFKLFNFFGSRADSIINRVQEGKVDNISNRIVLAVIIREELNDKLYKNNKPLIDHTPNWSKIQATIDRKYPGRLDARKIVMDAKIRYYGKTEQWKNYINVIVDKVEVYGFKSISITPGNFIARSFIFHCDDSLLLNRAILWMKADVLSRVLRDGYSQNVIADSASIHLSGNNDFSNLAGLLYKAGQKDEAIKWIEWHVKLMKLQDRNLFQENLKNKREILSRMKRGIPIDNKWKDYWFN